MIATALEPARDDALLVAARDGSDEAFGALAARYRGSLVQLAYTMTHDRHEANDIAQETLLRAYRGLELFHANHRFAGWLHAIARNAACDALRRRRRTTMAAVLTIEDSENPEEIALRNETARQVRLALATLPKQYRIAVELHYDAGLRYREIADRLQIPLGTVKTYIARGKLRLRAALEADWLASAACPGGIEPYAPRSDAERTPPSPKKGRAA